MEMNFHNLYHKKVLQIQKLNNKKYLTALVYHKVSQREFNY